MQVLVHLPDDLALRFKQKVPARKRSAFIAELLREALPAESDSLYQGALEVEQDEALNAEMAQWDVTVGDGLENNV